MNQGSIMEGKSDIAIPYSGQNTGTIEGNYVAVRLALTDPWECILRKEDTSLLKILYLWLYARLTDPQSVEGALWIYESSSLT